MATLSKLPRADEQMSRWSTRSGLNARLSDPDTFGDVPNAKALIADAHKSVHEAIQLVDRLTKDTTRTPPQLHDRARRAVTECGAAVIAAGEKLGKIAEQYEAKATEAVDEYANLDAMPQALIGIKVQWIKDNYNTENGAVVVRKATESDPHIGAILNRVDSYIFGMSEDFRQSMIGAAVKKWLPGAQQDQATADRLRDTITKWPKFVNDLHHSSYISSVAEQMRSRVED